MPSPIPVSGDGIRKACPLQEVPDDLHDSNALITPPLPFSTAKPMNTDADVITLEIADESSHGQAGATRRHHWTMLVACGAVVVLAFLLEVQGEQRVAITAAPRYPLPETCMSRQLFGLDCPGCGLTRSLVHLAHGDWHASMAVHRLGWMMAAAILLQFPYRISCLRHGRISPLGTRLPKWFGNTLICVLVANWLVAMVWHLPAH